MFPVITVALVLFSTGSQSPLNSVLPVGGKLKNRFQGNETTDVYGIVTGVAGKDVIAVVAKNDTEPVSYQTYFHLKSGKVWPGVKEPRGYRMQDVREGDHVRLSIYTEEKQKFCVDISVQKRPGGRVPPSWVEDPNFKLIAKIRYHEWMNETNDLKDFGIPRPVRK